MSELTHFNEQGHAKMVDVSEKKQTVRIARAQSSIVVNETIYNHITNKTIAKGDVLAVAQVAGIMGAKKTSELIPMCHPLALQSINIEFHWEDGVDGVGHRLVIIGQVKTTGHTGVEMEALSAVTIASLTVYDMCKAIDKGMVIGETFLLTKTGGTSSPDYQRA